MAILTILEGVLGKLAFDEIKAWLPMISRRISASAVLRLPEDKRDRYAEEWTADIENIPGPLSKILYSLELLRAASNIATLSKVSSISSRRNTLKWKIGRQVNRIAFLSVIMLLTKVRGSKPGDRLIYVRHNWFSRKFNVQIQNGELPEINARLLDVVLSVRELNVRWLQSRSTDQVG